MSDAKIPENVADNLSTLATEMVAMNTAVSLVVSTLQFQTKLLIEIAERAREKPPKSQVANAVHDLTDAIVRMGAKVDLMTAQFDRLLEPLAPSGSPDGEGANVPVVRETG
jgi:hypothetical protein